MVNIKLKICLLSTKNREIIQEEILGRGICQPGI